MQKKKGGGETNDATRNNTEAEPWHVNEQAAQSNAEVGTE
jgi:hypothetical protein